jgi:hypothetical protein
VRASVPSPASGQTPDRPCATGATSPRGPRDARARRPSSSLPRRRLSRATLRSSSRSQGHSSRSKISRTLRYDSRDHWACCLRGDTVSRCDRNHRDPAAPATLAENGYWSTTAIALGEPPLPLPAWPRMNIGPPHHDTLIANTRVLLAATAIALRSV